VILIVDDEPAVRCAVDRWLQLRGFETDTANDGAEAVEKCRCNHYEIVTMDLEMPIMSGVEAIQVLKRDFPDLPILVLTGFVNDVERLHGVTVDGILTKPIRMHELESAIRKIIKRT
jgi:two-component system OmpR family response regulator